MSLVLPKSIAKYLEADAANDAATAAICFSEDALVRDEGGDIRGLDAIVRWKEAAHARYQYTVEPLGLREDGKTVVMRARLAGTFPGSPVDVDCRFVLRDGLIARLSID